MTTRTEDVIRVQRMKETNNKKQEQKKEMTPCFVNEDAAEAQGVSARADELGRLIDEWIVPQLIRAYVSERDKVRGKREHGPIHKGTSEMFDSHGLHLNPSPENPHESR